METYRLELLDSAELPISTQEIACVDDDEALLRASSLAHPHAVRVWQAERRVGDIRGGIIFPRIRVA